MKKIVKIVSYRGGRRFARLFVSMYLRPTLDSGSRVQFPMNQFGLI
jgi:hypothetical protein